MVGRLLGLLQKEIRGLHEAAYLLGSFALLSQVLALVRDRLLAHSFGAGLELDVYYAAFRIPDIIFVGLASFVSVYVLIPFLAQKAAQSKEAEKQFIDTIFSGFGVLIVCASALAFFFAPVFLSFLFPDLSGSSLGSELVLLSRILLVQPLFLGFSNLLGSITQTAGRFVLYAVGPVLYNFGIIVGIVFLYPLWGLSGIAVGVVFGAFLHLAVQVPYVFKNGFFPRFLLAPNFSEVKRVVLFSLPRTIALSANQLSLLVLFIVASRMIEGSVTILQFSYNLQAVPLGIIGVSYSIAAFPTLAHLFSRGDHDLFVGHVMTAVRHIVLWSLPAIAFFIVLRAQIVRVILGSGAFDWTDTRLVAASLAILIVALTAQCFILLLTRGYYAAGNTRTPLLINGASAFTTVFFALGLLAAFRTYPTVQFFIESLLRVEGLPGTGILMLSLGYALSLILSALALVLLFLKDFHVRTGVFQKVFFESVAAAVALGVVARISLNILDDIFNIDTFWGIFAQGFFAGTFGIVVGAFFLWILKNREFEEAAHALHHKFWRIKTVAPEQIEL